MGDWFVKNITITEICDMMEIIYRIQVEELETKTNITIKVKMGENTSMMKKEFDNRHLSMLFLEGRKMNDMITSSFKEVINKVIPVDKIFDNICWDNLVTSEK